jgi:polyisoprenoid-binding protein YceI
MAATTTPLSGTFTADPVHSSFGFAVTYQGVSIYRGTLTDVTASLSGGRLEGIAKADSISIVRPEQFRAHVLGPDFFDASEHPEVSFASTDLDLREDGTATVTGELTIRGVARPVEATGTWTAPAADVMGNARGHLHLDAVVDRTEWGMTWNMALPTGGNALANDVTLTVDLSLIEQRA